MQWYYPGLLEENRTMKNVLLKPRTLENVKIFWEESQDEELGRLYPFSRCTLDEAIQLYEESLKPDARSYGKQSVLMANI